MVPCLINTVVAYSGSFRNSTANHECPKEACLAKMSVTNRDDGDQEVLSGCHKGARDVLLRLAKVDYLWDWITINEWQREEEPVHVRPVLKETWKSRRSSFLHVEPRSSSLV